MHYGLKLTPKMIADLAAGYQQGKTTTILSQEYNLSKATICRALRKVGIEPERKDNLFSLKDIDETKKGAIALDFRAGLSIKDLSRKYGYSASLMTRVLTEKGLWTKKPIARPTLKVGKVLKSNGMINHILSKEEQLEVCEKFVDGPYTKLELATEYEVHPDTISVILRRHDALIKRYIPEELLEMICEEYKQGVSIYSLSSAYGQNPITIKYWLTKRKILDTLGTEGASPQDLTAPKSKWSSAELRDKAKEDTPEMYEILKDVARDPQAGVRNRITAAQLVIERGHGKSREEVEEERDTESSTDKILKLMAKKK